MGDNDYTYDENVDKKKVQINGTGNRYLMKKVMGIPKIEKTREVCKHWDFNENELSIDSQIICINQLYFNNISSNQIVDNEKLMATILKQIQLKINCYKRQDMQKNLYNESEFVCEKDVILKLAECKLYCYYCKCKVHVLYDKARAETQWTIDRIDNNKGHNKNNYHISCLKCNLERRKLNDEKFKFTKQLIIKKHE